MLIWGWQRRVRTLAMITLVCAGCGNPAAQALRKLTTMFTLFFIPLIPLGSKHHLECTWCGAEFKVLSPQVPDLLAQADAQAAGGQYQQFAPPSGNGAWPQQQPAPQYPNTNWPPRQ